MGRWSSLSEDFNLRSKNYWKRLFWGLFVGLLSAIGAFIFIYVMNWGQRLIFPSLTNWTPFSGPWYMVVIMTVMGLVVGLLHRYTSAKQIDVFEAVNTGKIDPKPLPSSLLVSVLSLISGFSLGPEVPTGMLAAGLGSWISKKRKLNDKTSKTNVISGVSGAYAGLFSSPFVVLLMLLESSHLQTIAYYGTLLIAGLAAAIGFELFYALNGQAVSSLLGILTLPVYNLHYWDLFTGIILGIVAVPVAIIFVIINKIIKRLVEPLNSKPVIRSTLGGFLLGLLAVAIPTTIGLGTTQMSVVTEQAATIGVLLLIVFALAKIVALSGALNFGFIGGPIFPLLFVGSCLGALIHLIFPQIPLALAMGCMIVAVPAAIVPIPLALAAIGIIVVGVPFTDSLPLILAALVAFAITHGLMGNNKNKADKTV
jgi:H+/Cl- antiporter ClcA